MVWNLMAVKWGKKRMDSRDRDKNGSFSDRLGTGFVEKR